MRILLLLTKWSPAIQKVGQGHPKTVCDDLGCTSIGVSNLNSFRECVLQILRGNERRAAPKIHVDLEKVTVTLKLGQGQNPEHIW